MKNPIAQGFSLERCVAICILFVGALAGAVIYFDAQSHLLRFFDWLEEIGAWAPLLFILIDMLVVVFVLPGVMLTLGSRSSSRSQAEWAMYGIGLIITIAAVVYITRLARRALDDYTSEKKPP